MDAQKVDMFLMTNSKYFEGHQIPYLKDELLKIDDSRFIILQTLNLKDPTIALIISLIGGGLGIDRFFVGDVGMGIGKLITCGGFGIWAIVDWFLIMGRTKEVNMQRLRLMMMF
jgi:TM2 domain-containing membrane protein YozV